MFRVQLAGGAPERRLTLRISRAGEHDAGATVAGAGHATLGREEGQQVGVELVLVRVGQAVGCPWIDLQGGILNEFR
jgi:hypothetical protein